MGNEKPQAASEGSIGQSESTGGLGLVERLEEIVRDMTENREPRMVDWPGILRQAADAIRQLRDAPRAISAEADFDDLTWTFKVMPDCRIGAGIYALVWQRPNVVGEGPPERRSRGGNQQAQLVGGPSRPKC